MRPFVKLREMLASHKDLARKLEELEKKYVSQFQVVFNLEFPVACHRDDIFIDLVCERECSHTERISLCMADTLSHCFSGEVSEGVVEGESNRGDSRYKCWDIRALFHRG
jgi:hypothetical protein